MRAETVILGAAGTPPVRLTRFVVSASAKVPLKVDAAALTPNPIDGVPVYPVGTVIKLATVGPENRAEALAESDAAPAVIVPATLIPLLALTLLILPRVKGAVIGLLYAVKITRADGALHTADRLE